MMHFMSSADYVVFDVMAMLVSGTAAAIDVCCRRIPNWLTLSGFGMAILLKSFYGGPGAVLNSIAAAAIAGSILFMFFLAGGMGAGDVKLVAACASFLGVSSLPMFLQATALAGGLMAVVLIVWKGLARSVFRNLMQLLTHHATAGVVPHTELNVENSQTVKLPYGVAIACGVLAVLMLQLHTGN